jgi:hypothetical protein
MRVVDNPNGKEYGESMLVVIPPPTKKDKSNRSRLVNQSASTQVDKIQKLANRRKGKKFVNGKYV